MKKLLFIVAIVAAGLVSAKGSVVSKSDFSSVEKSNTTNKVNISVKYSGFMGCTFLVSVTDPKTGETTQWRETYTVSSVEECAKIHSARKAELEKAAEVSDSVEP